MEQSLHRAAFQDWVAAARGKPTDGIDQDAASELLAEHHMMTCVVVSLEHEANTLGNGGELRPDYWHNAVDFIGNFVHQCHRAKEELHFFPTAEKAGLIDTKVTTALEREHENAKQLTLGICDGVGEGDGEKVMRLVSMYAYFMRPHMRREEEVLVGPLMTNASDATKAALVTAFANVERDAMAGRDRLHILDVARKLCAGLPIAEQLNA